MIIFLCVQYFHGVDWLYMYSIIIRGARVRIYMYTVQSLARTAVDYRYICEGK